MSHGPDPTLCLAVALPGWAVGSLATLALWLLASALVEAAAARAQRLATRAAPPCFGRTVDLPPGSTEARLAFLGDLQRGVVDTVGPVAEALSAARADLLVSSGDFVSHGEAPYYGVLLAAFERARVPVPVRVVPGNHDLLPRRSKDDRIGGELFERHFGRRRWAERVGPVLLVGLDVGADWLLDGQMAWMREVLEAHAGLPWILVCHRPPFHFDLPGAPPFADLTQLPAALQARPPLLVVSGHLHDYRDETVRGVRYVVNAHGGDVHGLGLRRGDFELLHVTVRAGGGLEVEPRRYRRRLSWRAAFDQACVRLWAERRRPLGAVLSAPVHLVLRVLGRHVPIVRHPVERRYPERAVLEARRRRPLGDGRSPR
jgi:3',5'-cyclic AMP phosphodiesterase CpdA